MQPIDGPLDRELDIQRRALQSVRDRLPADWSFDISSESTGGRRQPDAVVTVTDPSQATAMLLVEAKRSVVTRDLPYILEQLESAARDSRAPNIRPMVVARYLAPSVRQWLESREAAYADASGNIYVQLDTPAVFLRGSGADRDPWRGPGRPRGTLRGIPASRVVRALTDFRPPMTVPQLVERSRASTGATYRVVDFLAQDALLEREHRGPIVATSWRRMLERWSQDYGCQSSNSVVSVLQPRGLSCLVDDLRNARGLKYAMTGSLAAANGAAYAPARLAMLYVDDPVTFIDALNLRSTDTGANVLVASPKADFVFDRSVSIGDVTYAAPSQVAVDLLTGPGRSPAEGGALLSWMEENEDAWRS